MMGQLNCTLEEESKTLLRQMDTLIIQNQDLLQQTLMDKEHYHAEERELTEKMNLLKRHKEKLEEKIMDQYRTMDSPIKKKDNILQRAARVFNPKQTSRKSSLGHKGAFSSGDDASADDGGFRSLTLPNGNFDRNNHLYSSLPHPHGHPGARTPGTPRIPCPAPALPTQAPLAKLEDTSSDGASEDRLSVLTMSRDVPAAVLTTPSLSRRGFGSSVPNSPFTGRRSTFSNERERKLNDQQQKESSLKGIVNRTVM